MVEAHAHAHADRRGEEEGAWWDGWVGWGRERGSNGWLALNGLLGA